MNVPDPLRLSPSGKHGVGRIDIVENRFIGMKSRGKELKMILLSICLYFDILWHTCATWQPSSLWQTVLYAVKAVRWTYSHSENTPQSFNFTSVQKLSFQDLGLFMQLAVILHECFKCHNCYSTSIKVGWMANALFKGNVLLWFTWNHRLWVTSNHVCMHTQRENTHTVNKMTVGLASLDTNKHTVDHTCAHAVTRGGFCLFLLGINRHLFHLLSYVSTCVTAANMQRK